MCDFRGPPSHIKYRDGTTEELKHMGHLDPNQYPSGVGIYHVGASGCGYEYFDGRFSWSMGYNEYPPELSVYETVTLNKDTWYKRDHLATIRASFSFLYNKPNIFLNDIKTIENPATLLSGGA